jgi:PAS domain S-box-containing protein
MILSEVTTDSEEVDLSAPGPEGIFAISDEQRYRSIFLNAIEGIFQTTLDGRYLGANPALARIYGYHTAEELQTHLQDIGRQLYVRPERRAEFVALMECQGEVTNFESQVFRKDGAIIWISENAVAVRDNLGQLLYYEGFVVDVTARHAAEAALQKTREELERSLAELPWVEW